MLALGLLGNVFGWFKDHPQLAAILGLAVALGITDLRLNHAKSDLANLRKANEAAAAQARLQASNAAIISDNARKTLDQRQAQITSNTSAVLKRTPPHVASSDPRFYPWPWYALRLYDASLGLPAVPSAPGQPDEAASPVGAADALPVLIRNNDACRTDQATLEALQGWVSAQAANARK